METTALIAINAIILTELRKLQGITDWDDENGGMEDLLNLLIEIEDDFNIWITSGTTCTDRNIEYINVEVFNRDWPEGAEEVEFEISAEEDVKKLISHIKNELDTLKAEE